jgi:ATP-dependent helicase HrpB
MARLPIDTLLPELVTHVRTTRRVVLRAAPGAGKTTRVPAAVLDAGLAGERQVLVVEPRRIAARAAAAFVARERGGEVGGEIGYQVRFEREGGPRTRVWYLTEGVFGRRLASDPFLERTGVVVLDEFHERHLDGDLALAVVRHLQDTVRPDLGLVVMSATLAEERVARVLPGAVVLTAAGRTHPVTITHLDDGRGRDTPGKVLAALGRLVAAPDDDGGDVLVFLAGARDMRRTRTVIAPLAAARGLRVEMLHGTQPLAEQARVLRGGAGRRVVLATNVAETSLTVEGVTAVIDAGEARVARLDPRLGVNRLHDVPISRASAAQRAGRAGRIAPGRCIRLWTKTDDAGRREHETPEISRLDLSRLLLSLAAWGMAGAEELGWVDPPAPAALATARRLLADLGALAPGGLSEIGRRMLRLPLEPRLARVALEAERCGAGADGALLAALAGERDIVSRGGERDDRAAPGDWPAGPSDLSLRAELFADAARRDFREEACRALGLDRSALRAVERVRRQLAEHLRSGRPADADEMLRSLLAGFPDRVARRRAPGDPRAVMVGGAGVRLAPASVVRDAEYFVCVDVEHGGGPDALVRLASAVRREWLAALGPGAVEETTELVFDEARARVMARTRTRYRDLVLAESVRTSVDRAAAGDLLAAAVLRAPAERLSLDERTTSVLARLGFLAAAMPELGLPAEPEALLAEALRALCVGRTSIAELRRADVAGAVEGLLTPAQRAALPRDAPTHYRLPSDRHAPIAYRPDRPPSIAARIQELFGLGGTPRLAGGRVPLVVELLAPNQRPVQVTDDLASFWRTTYAEVRKQLRGRYPKHAWPENPHDAPATRRRRRA